MFMTHGELKRFLLCGSKTLYSGVAYCKGTSTDGWEVCESVLCEGGYVLPYLHQHVVKGWNMGKEIIHTIWGGSRICFFSLYKIWHFFEIFTSFYIVRKNPGS